jgi:hypothetical protein
MDYLTWDRMRMRDLVRRVVPHLQKLIVEPWFYGWEHKPTCYDDHTSSEYLQDLMNTDESFSDEEADEDEKDNAA